MCAWEDMLGGGVGYTYAWLWMWRSPCIVCV